MVMKQPVTARFQIPPADLSGFFTSFYAAEVSPDGAAPLTDWLHPEWGGLRIFCGATPESRIADQPPLANADLVLTGPSSVPLHFSIGETRIWGVGFLPLGWATFVGQSADRYANTVNDGRTNGDFTHFVPLADRLTQELRRQPDTGPADLFAIMEEFFRHEAPRFGNCDPRIQAIHSALIEPELPDVCELAELCGVHPRTLERLCRRHFGFSPKLLLRRQRFMRSLTRYMLDPSLRWIGAIDPHYVDQSHFVRDCHNFLGMAPSEYVNLDHPILAAFMLERKRVLGSPVQTLDRPLPH
ncbi:helix-turn-helix domain-containing protein [Allopontixanthobacter sp.]|uniref:helix-turn-helix domain-containing protein n=1 Tax=Allopontixanthobacter sp. TaxID=2906452 RepID=UPI002AB8ED0E|nr:helix-turn-helix domain-containing protein [Allopontixanthobacter sp.]MDZ4308355.1 helix-turn-helix domain-containing protein [Allopontixanthobacter sp.]